MKNEVNVPSYKSMMSTVVDLVNPVTAVAGLAHLLKGDRAVKKNEELMNLVDLLDQSSYRMANLLRALLLTNSLFNIKYEYGNFLRRVEFVRRMSHSISSVARYHSREQDIAFYDACVSGTVSINEEHMTFVFEEFLRYAFDYTPVGKSVFVNVSNSTSSEFVITLTCNGEDTKTGQLEDNNLEQGLSPLGTIDVMPTFDLCRKIIQLHGGELFVYEKSLSGRLVIIKLKS